MARPEAKIQREIVEFLNLKGWHVEVTHGNMWQQGLPDLYAMHPRFGTRWIEVKLPDMKGSHFTSAQLKKFPLFNRYNVGIWIMTAANEAQYQWLFQPCNWGVYLCKIKGVRDRASDQKVLDELFKNN